MATYDNVQDALYAEMRELLKRGKLVPSRNGMTRERRARKITLRYPRQRFLSCAARDANPFAQVAETLWVLAGRNDIGFLEPYLSHAPEFSDDGKRWRAGYGPRLRQWDRGGGERIDQVAEVLRILRADPLSRRAVIGLFDPAVDFADSKDIPCNNWLQFLARDGSLDVHVVTRSNDIMWGWSGINVFEWSVLQEAIAVDLGMRVGKMTFFAGSFHLYERHWKKAQRVVDEGTRKSPHLNVENVIEAVDPADPRIRTAWPEFASQIHAVLREVESGRPAFHTISQRKMDPWLSQCVKMLAIYADSREKRPGDELRKACEQLRGAFRIVAIEWLERRGLIEDSSFTVGGDSRLSPVAEGDVLDGGEGRNATGGAESQTNGEKSDLPSSTVGLRQILDTLGILEAAKSRSYGDSWKKYGELLSIFPNICRKTDRIAALSHGSQATSDETLWDTVGDCAVYAIKYMGWQLEQRPDVTSVGFLAAGARLLESATMPLGQSGLSNAARTQLCLREIAEASEGLRQLLYARADALTTQADTPSHGEARWNYTVRLASAALSWLAASARRDPAEWQTYAGKILEL